jgi:hypothetical protein
MMAVTLEFSPNIIGFFAEVIALFSAHTASNRKPGAARLGYGAIQQHLLDRGGSIPSPGARLERAADSVAAAPGGSYPEK